MQLNLNIWINNDEVVGNMLDDDANGYVDDVFGWNFIGGQDSSHVNYDTFDNKLGSGFKRFRLVIDRSLENSLFWIM